MKFSSTLALIIIVLILVLAGFFYFEFASHTTAPTTATSTAATVTNLVNYSCDNSKTIKAAYSANSVNLTLSDGRTLTLPQTISGSGIRYESTSTPGDDIVFSSEGDNAMLMENSAMPYADCVANASAGTTATTTGMDTFTDQGKTFTFQYPSQFSVTAETGYSQDWEMNSSANGLLLAKIMIPNTFEPNTNFGDATFTVGTSPDPGAVAQCLTAPANGPQSQTSTTTINGVTYAKIVSSDAGAGQIYQTTSYRTIRNGQCYAIEYTIHSGQIDNYPPSSGVTAFDQAKIENVLQAIVQSFIFIS